MFEHALELLGVDAAQAVMVGDSPTKDVAPAKKLGVRAADPAVGDAGPAICTACQSGSS
jgi:FMN phosphatase YigB (HAD superfamily)